MASMLAMPAPSPYPAMLSRPSWPEYRRPDEPIELPPIRLAVPEFTRLSIPPPPHAHQSSGPSLPHNVVPNSAPSPQYSLSYPPRISKRRRLSFEEDQEVARAPQIPRLRTATPGGDVYRQNASLTTSPTKPSTWNSSSDVPQHPLLVDAPAPRPRLPSLPLSIPVDRAGGQSWHSRESSVIEQRTPLTQELRQPLSAAAAEPNGPTPSSYGFPSPVNGRYQTSSVGTTSPYERSQPASYRDMSRMGELPHLSISTDNKQRKRRGNLPKETTDKLRSWLQSHLQHPYPTEDEKQELMRQTGLQMNQISNWFINARRRQLPYNKSGRPDPDASGHRPLASKPPNTLDGKHHSEGEGGPHEDERYAHERYGTTRIERGSV